MIPEKWILRHNPLSSTTIYPKGKKSLVKFLKKSKSDFCAEVKDDDKITYFSVAVNCSITIFFACYCISVEGWKLLYVIGLVEALIFCGLGWLLSGFTVSSATTWTINGHSSRIRHSSFLLAALRGHEFDNQRNVQLQEVQLLEERTR